MKLKHLSNPGLWLLLLGACTDGEPMSGGGDAAATSSSLTFQRDVRPLIETHCSSCHKAGGIGPFALGYEPGEWKSGKPGWAGSAVAAVESRTMPPWKPDPECRDYEHSRRLSDDQVAVFTGWRDAGFPLGEESDYVRPEPPKELLGEPTLTLMPEQAYTPRAELGDDYRCFLLPASFDQESYLVGTDIVPGARRHVHHVILYTVDSNALDEVLALDKDEAGPGYTCFGGPGVGRSQNVGGWAPGMVPNVAPTDSARVLPGGTRLIMQVHYNTSGLAKGEPPDEDRTGARLWLMPQGKVPKYRITTLPIAHTDILIKAFDAESIQTRAYSMPATGTIVGVTPHMHTLGTRIEVVRKHDDACLVRIPDWDFHWQQGYRFAEDSYLEVARGDSLTLTCVYDNSGKRGDHAAHGGSGEQHTPVDVRWGEGTTDEMCLNYLELRTPFGASLADACPTYPACIDACAQGASLCLASCGATSASCSDCVTPGLAACAPGRCETEGLAVQKCSGECGKDCPPATCRPQIEAFFTCMEPALRDGSCDALLARCGG